ncbi:MAG: hypothetical protein AAF648_06645 [Pseudomonadota bacterium]
MFLVFLSSYAQAAGPSVAVVSNVPFSEPGRVAANVRTECTELGTKLSKFLVQFSKKKLVTIEQVNAIDLAASGYTLDLKIDDAVSMGNAFQGHAKFMQATGVLYRDGKEVARTTFTRNSMGGAFAAYKGSCSVLGRNSKALGKDFAQWLSVQVSAYE